MTQGYVPLSGVQSTLEPTADCQQDFARDIYRLERSVLADSAGARREEEVVQAFKDVYRDILIAGCVRRLFEQPRLIGANLLV
jgi:hypothetical protein